MGRTGSGVEIRDVSIRVKFALNGKTYRERLTLNGQSLAPTPANIKYAHRLAMNVRRAIETGSFRWEDFFPESKHNIKPEDPLFADVAQQWLASKSASLTRATKSQYANAIKIWANIFGHATMGDLTYQVLASKIGGHPWASGKLANNYLIPLRGIFDFYYAGPRNAENPCAGIKNLKFVKPPPDPLTADERDAILDHMYRTYDARVWAYFTFLFFTGLRPEEAIALKWEDIDFHAKTARIQRVRTFKGTQRNGSKTHAVRDVDLVPQAIDALLSMKKHTLLKRNTKGEPVDIFENPVTLRPWHDERSQRDHYWKPTLRILGIRDRRAYCTRHTYATCALTGGVNPHYVARQLGHKSTKMLFDVYAKWIDGADKGTQKSALESALSSQIRPKEAIRQVAK